MVRVPLRYVPVIAREYAWRLVLDGAIEVDLSRVESLADELAGALRKSLTGELLRAVVARRALGDALPLELSEELLDLPGIGLGDAFPLELSEELRDRTAMVLGDAAVLRIVESTVSHLSTSGAVGGVRASRDCLCTTLRKLLERDRHSAERDGGMDRDPPPGSSEGGASPASAPAELGRPDSVRRRLPEPDDEFDLG